MSSSAVTAAGAAIDSNLILNILGNETRRKILSVLSEEPMYFNQLSKQIGIGQQAILRHMQALEDAGLVKAYHRKSILGAPKRKYYCLNTSFSITISISQDSFSVENNSQITNNYQKQKKKKKKWNNKNENNKELYTLHKNFKSILKGSSNELASTQKSLVNINNQISYIELYLNDVRKLKQIVLHRLHEIGEEKLQQLERKVLYKGIAYNNSHNNSPLSISMLAELLNENQSNVKDAIERLQNKLDKHSIRKLFRENY